MDTVMNKLREIRLKAIGIFSRFEAYIMPACKFVLAMVVFCFINSKFGHMGKIAKFPIAIILALLCSFMPMNLIVIIAALLTLAHAYALSMEAAIVLAAVYMIMFLLFFKFSPKATLAAVLTPICLELKIPYVIPISCGLVGTPASAVASACGVITFYMLKYVEKCVEAFSEAKQTDMVVNLKTMLTGIIGNKAMIVMSASFLVTIIVVYVVRRMAIKHSWTIAIAVGALTNMLILLAGDVAYQTNISIIGLFFGTILGCIVAFVFKFVAFDVDYNKLERVQFEDEDYYYYVKAVPKIKAKSAKAAAKAQNASEERVRERRANISKSEYEAVKKPQNGVDRDKSYVTEEKRVQTERPSERTRKRVDPSDPVAMEERQRRREESRRREKNLNMGVGADNTPVREKTSDNSKDIVQTADDDLGLSRSIAYQKRKMEERNSRANENK